MKIKNIVFTLENCERVEFDGKYVAGFNCSDIRKSISRVACNAIIEMNTVHDFCIEIAKEANGENHPFGMLPREGERVESKFERLHNTADITSVEFDLYEVGENGEEINIKHYDYFVDWCGEDEYTNAAQKSYISSLGNLYIVINSRIMTNPEIFNEYFDLDEIEDAETVQFIYEMYDIYPMPESDIQAEVKGIGIIDGINSKSGEQ